jgi:hypothetical protein
VEWLLDRIFGRWKREIKSISQIENSVVAVVRLHYWNPVVNEWDFHDGTGAMPIQVDKDCKASDMVSIKAAAIQMAAPAAASYALKDAADNLGKLFGRDITRKDTVAWDPSFKEDPYVTQPLADGDKAPPPPPKLPDALAAKVVAHTTPMDATPAVLGGAHTEAMAAAVEFTPPVFDASAFAPPGSFTQSEKKQPVIQAADLNTSINF